MGTPPKRPSIPGLVGSKVETSRVPSLDGLRAVSIGMVLIAHSAGSIPALESHPLILYTFGNGNRGVSVFFVISGFLITSLLLKEERRKGAISLRDFYIRRALRILPPFYVFLAFLILAWQLGQITTNWRSLGVSFVFLRDYFGGDWWTGHSWSLSVEEQFYLLWPMTLALLGRNWAKRISLFLIAGSPVMRTAFHILVGRQQGPIENFMLHMRVDGLMFGCALALYQEDPHVDRFLEKILRWPLLLAALGFLVFGSGILTQRFQGYYLLPFGYTLENLAITYVIVYFVRRPLSIGGRLLNCSPMVHIGLISYSLYLWQEAFLTPNLNVSLSGRFPYNWICTFAAAELSWLIIEKPALKLRRQFTNRITPLIARQEAA